MSTETDIRLRSWLDANQRDREQMCRSILAISARFSEVRPRHPSGGPDGGRDIEAVFDGSRIVYGAVGFQNGANDSDEQKRRIRAKFANDLASAIEAKPDLKVFSFLTNVHLPKGEQSEMTLEAKKMGIEHCEILDRERLRIELDSPAGFFIRFQFLGIPLSEAEQASFLSHYGDKIQDVVSTGFQRVEKTLNRLLFLNEANRILDSIHVRFTLDRAYSASEIGHFRAFVHMYLRAVKYDILSVWFGSSDKAGRFAHDVDADPSGIGHGIGSGQWEEHISRAAESEGDESASLSYVPVGSGSSIGVDPVSSITISYNHDDNLIRLRQRLSLIDLDEGMFMPIVSESLSGKISAIDIYANGYKLISIDREEFKIDRSKLAGKLPGNFSDSELNDKWVRLRPSEFASAFSIEFSSKTPRRIFDHTEIEARFQSR